MVALLKISRWKLLHKNTTYCFEPRLEAKLFYGLLHMDAPGLANQQGLTYIISIWSQNAVLKTCQEQWAIGTDSKRESRISVLSARFHPDDIIYIYIYLGERGNSADFHTLKKCWFCVKKKALEAVISVSSFLNSLTNRRICASFWI